MDPMGYGFSILRLPSVLLVLSCGKLCWKLLYCCKNHWKPRYPVDLSNHPVHCSPGDSLKIFPIFHCKTPTKLKPNPLIQRRNSPFVRPQRSLGAHRTAVNWKQLAHFWCWKCGNSGMMWYVMWQKWINKPVNIRYFQGALSTFDAEESQKSNGRRFKLLGLGWWDRSVQPRSHCKWCNY